MHLNTKKSLKLGVCCVGVLLATYVGKQYWNFLNENFTSRPDQPSGVQVALKPLEQVALPPKYEGPPFVPVGVLTQAVYTTEFGPVVHMRFVDLEVNRCPVYGPSGWRFSKSSPPKQTVSIRAEGAWCLEALPGQRLQPKTLTGDLFDYRTDSFLANDSKVEYVDIKLADGNMRSVFVGSISVCDNDGVCAASVVTELTHPARGMSFKLPMLYYGDVVRYGPRASIGLRDDTAPLSVESFIAIQREHKSHLLSPEEWATANSDTIGVEDHDEYTAAQEDTLDEPEGSYGEYRGVTVSPVYEDNDIIVNSLPALDATAHSPVSLSAGH